MTTTALSSATEWIAGSDPPIKSEDGNDDNGWPIRSASPRRHAEGVHAEPGCASLRRSYLEGMKARGALGLAIGVTMGVAVGAATDNVASGIGIGIALGIALNYAFRGKGGC